MSMRDFINIITEGVETLEETLHGEAFFERFGWIEETLEEAEYRGRKVKLNKPFRTPDGPKKFSVYVKNDKGNVVKVNFGDKNMEIRRDNLKARKNFRARHGCDDNPGPKWKARYWSCRTWDEEPVSKIVS